MQDLISRQAAIDVIEHRLAEPAYQHTGEDWYVGMNCAESEIYELPSVQPEPCEDTISRADAIRVASGYCHPANVAKELAKLPSVQAEPSTEIQEILDYLDTTLHPIVSPDNWYVYSELHDMISRLPSAQPDNSCDGCRYENADDGVLVPCGFCKRSHPDNYERRTDEDD